MRSSASMHDDRLESVVLVTQNVNVVVIDVDSYVGSRRCIEEALHAYNQNLRRLVHRASLLLGPRAFARRTLGSGDRFRLERSLEQCKQIARSVGSTCRCDQIDDAERFRNRIVVRASVALYFAQLMPQEHVGDFTVRRSNFFQPIFFDGIRSVRGESRIDRFDRVCLQALDQ